MNDHGGSALIAADGAEACMHTYINMADAVLRVKVFCCVMAQCGHHAFDADIAVLFIKDVGGDFAADKPFAKCSDDEVGIIFGKVKFVG